MTSRWSKLAFFGKTWWLPGFRQNRWTLQNKTYMGSTLGVFCHFGTRRKSKIQNWKIREDVRRQKFYENYFFWTSSDNFRIRRILQTPVKMEPLVNWGVSRVHLDSNITSGFLHPQHHFPRLWTLGCRASVAKSCHLSGEKRATT